MRWFCGLWRRIRHGVINRRTFGGAGVLSLSPFPKLLPGERVVDFRGCIWRLSGKSVPSSRLFFSLPPLWRAALYVTDRRLVVVANAFWLINQEFSVWFREDAQTRNHEFLKDASAGKNSFGSYVEVISENTCARWYRSRRARTRIYARDSERLLKTVLGAVKGEVAQAPALARSSHEPSRAAIMGAILNSLGVLAAVLLLAFLHHEGHLSSKEGVSALLLGTGGALFLTSGIFSGWIAVGQIRRSAGRLRGLGLAVLGGLLFPLLALDFAVLTVGANFIPVANRPPGTELKDTLFTFSGVVILVIALGLVAMLDWAICRAVWRAVKRGVPTAPTKRKGAGTVVLASYQLLLTLLCLIWAGLAVQAGIEGGGGWHWGPLLMAVLLIVPTAFFCGLNGRRLVAPVRLRFLQRPGLALTSYVFTVLATVLFLWLFGFATTWNRSGPPGTTAETAAGGAPLQSAATATNRGTAIFGPVIERTMSGVNERRTNCFLDFDTAKIVDPPIALDLKNRQAVFDWSKSNGVDVVANTEVETRGLLGYELTATEVPDTDWESPDFTAINQRMANTSWARFRFGGQSLDQSVMTVNTVSTEPKRTYAFRTREGGFGLLQFEEYTDAPGGKLKFRYKLLEGSKQAAGPRINEGGAGQML